MLKELIIIVNLISFLLFAYGLLNAFLELEPNACQMTYMYEVPQFHKLHVTKRKFFSNYGLYYYYESKHRINEPQLNGAPVLFVPGNGGSYRQVRSLASVAIRMKTQYKNNLHLDYFTIDFGEELSALHGGYLEKQKYFLKLCMRKISNLYKQASNETVKMAIIGHSMGGVLGKSVLCEENYAKQISSIISLSTPLDRPVLNLDSKINTFYEESNSILQEKLEDLNEILRISIGGGVRDLQVPAWLTTSSKSNIHAMSSAIPNVWLSCDHLSIVWCLQLMKVINRYLHSVLERQKDNRITFKQDFESKIQAANWHFVGNKFSPVEPSEQFDLKNDVWHLETARQFHKTYKQGLENDYRMLLPLPADAVNEHIYIEIAHAELNDWLYACIAEKNQSGKLVCRKMYALTHKIAWLPTEKRKSSYALLDMSALKNNVKDCTHIQISLPATRQTLTLLMDTFDPRIRYIQFKAANWLDMLQGNNISETLEGAAYTQLIITNLHDSYHSLAFNFKKIDCTTKHSITIRVVVNWAKGFDVFHIFGANEAEKSIIVNVPTDSMPAENSTQDLVYIHIHSEPNCRLNISQQFSYQHTMRSIMQRFYAYLPAYLTAILILLLTQQYNSSFATSKNVFKNVFLDFFNIKSLTISILCNLAYQFLPRAVGILQTDTQKYSLFITVILQGTAFVLSILISLGILCLLTICASIFKCITPKISSISRIFALSFVPTILTLRITLGMVIVSITLVTCCGVGLALAYLVYFFWLSNAYQVELLCTKELATAADGPTNPTELRNKSPNNFMLHFKLLQLLLVVLFLNATEILAWLIKYPQPRRFVCSDLQSVAIILLLLSWIVLWEMQDLYWLCGSKIVLFLLYGSAMACMFYVQKNVFRLNYVIALVFLSFVSIALLCKLQKLKRKYL